jgi:hypothetical protein
MDRIKIPHITSWGEQRKKKYIALTRDFVKCYSFRKTLDFPLPFPVYILPAAAGECFQIAVLVNCVVRR